MNKAETIKRLMLLMPSLFGFYTSGGKFQNPKHIKYINNEIIKFLSVRNIDTNILIISMPPRHGKSELISKYLPAWYLLNNPEKRVILASYETTFAISWGRKNRDLISEYGKLYNIFLDDSSKSVSSFEIKKHKGGMIATGVGGAITGYGADLFIIDDPVKNYEEANSKVYRDRIFNWFTSVATTRLEPNGKIIIIMTRWHKDDLIGRVKELWQNRIEEIILPAIAQKNDILGRQEGEALWSERFPIGKLNEIKDNIGEYFYNALYLQDPSMTNKGLFKYIDFRYFKRDGDNIELLDTDKQTNQRLDMNDIEYIYATMDLAISERSDADYTVLTIFGVYRNQLLILDVFRDKIKPIEHVEIIKQYYQRYNFSVIYIEAVQYQMALLQQIAELGIPVEKTSTQNKNKFIRAIPLSAYIQNHKIYFDLNSRELSIIENEMIEFPFGKHDDIVDTFAYGVQAYQEQNTNRFEVSVL